MITAEQQSIAEASADSRQLVTAGAGTGKTYVLIERLVYLVEAANLSPGQEILLLSFSRAAVSEIRRRVKAATGNVGFIQASTFDSFATRLLSIIEPDGDWTAESYEGRITRATLLIETEPEAQEFLSDYRHVLVDEVQDLVGERAELVKSILTHTSGGFTLFGDPAQGIYNFQLEGEARLLGCAVLYRDIRRLFGSSLKEPALSQNFRAQSEITRRPLEFGLELSGESPDFAAIRSELDTIVFELPSLGPMSSAHAMLRACREPTAILCRTNGEALLVSGELYGAAIDHRYQRRATDRAVSGWVARCFSHLPHPSVSRRQFLERIEGLREQGAKVDSEEAWNLLKRMDQRRGQEIDVAKVAKRIVERNVPDELCSPEEASIVVSTIHRAKGLEFDRVIVMGSSEVEDDESTIGEETRLLYVSLTRPKFELFHADVPEATWLRKAKDADERWVLKGWKKWMTRGVEVRGEDIHSSDPAGGYILRGIDPAATQRYLADEVKRGDRLTMERIISSVTGASRVFYAVRHKDSIIGVTSEAFGGTLLNLLKVNSRWNVQWPKRIEEIFVEAVDSVAGSSAAGIRSGLGSSGIWLRVRPVGMGRLVFEKSGSGK